MQVPYVPASRRESASSMSRRILRSLSESEYANSFVEADVARSAMSCADSSTVSSETSRFFARSRRSSSRRATRLFLTFSPASFFRGLAGIAAVLGTMLVVSLEITWNTRHRKVSRSPGIPAPSGPPVPIEGPGSSGKAGGYHAPPRIKGLAGDPETARRFGHVSARLVQDEGDVGVRELAQGPAHVGRGVEERLGIRRARELDVRGVDRGRPRRGCVVRGPADDVLELAKIPAPGVREQHASRGRREGGRPAGGLRERACRRKKVFASLGESRKAHRDDREPVEEILPKRPGARPARQIRPGRGHEASLERQQARAPHAPHEALLDDAEELALGPKGKRVDPVEVERALARALEKAWLPRDRTRERSALVAEELALEKVVRHSREVHAHKRRARAGRALVEKAREPVLASPGRSEKEHGIRRVRGAREPPKLLPQAAMAGREEHGGRGTPRHAYRNAAVASGASPQSLSRP